MPNPKFSEYSQGNFAILRPFYGVINLQNQVVLYTVRLRRIPRANSSPLA